MKKKLLPKYDGVLKLPSNAAVLLRHFRLRTLYNNKKKKKGAISFYLIKE